jgi:hypothetical protein
MNLRAKTSGIKILRIDCLMPICRPGRPFVNAEKRSGEEAPKIVKEPEAMLDRVF